MDFQHEKGRIFALDADGKLLAEVTFPAENGVATITHTFVDDSLRGQGVASQILAEAAEQIRASGLRMNATCHVAAKWIAKHTEFSDLTTAPLTGAVFFLQGCFSVPDPNGRPAACFSTHIGQEGGIWAGPAAPGSVSNRPRPTYPIIYP